ncbi:peptidase inhibitor family I36 protein [Actinomadura chokoriensis]|uniref:Peptidase inhibitor family I36 n=1 Tax=Actinomadura chokoriensis TaxID=454156 RepID=A0ABV4R9U2_9ACTN
MARRTWRITVAAAFCGAAGLLAATPAQATSCFWEDPGQHGSSRCYDNNVQNFGGQTFPNGHNVQATASSWRNLNTVWNEIVYSEPNFTGQSQELEDETDGNLNPGINDHLGSFDAA